MRTFLGHLIIISPGVSRAWKRRFSRRTILTILSCSILAVGLAAVLGVTFPDLVNEQDRTRLESENRELRVQNKDIHLKIGKLNSRLQEIEQMSNDVSTRLKAD